MLFEILSICNFKNCNKDDTRKKDEILDFTETIESKVNVKDSFNFKGPPVDLTVLKKMH